MSRIRLIVSCIMLLICSWGGAVERIDSALVQKEQESILQQVKSIKNSQERLQAWKDAAWRYQSPPFAMVVARGYYAEAVAQNDLKGKYEAAYYICNAFDNDSEADSLQVWVSRMKNYAQETGDYNDYLEATGALCRALAFHKQTEHAIFLARQGVDLGKKHQSKAGTISCLSSLNCCYAVTGRKDEALAVAEEGFRMVTPDVKLRVRLEIISRIISTRMNMGIIDKNIIIEMEHMLHDADPVLRANLAKYEIDMETRYCRYFMHKRVNDSILPHVERAERLLTPYIRQGFAINVRLMRLQYYSKIKEYDKAIAFTDVIMDEMEKNFTSSYVELNYFKINMYAKKNDLARANQLERWLIEKKDSMFAEQCMAQLEELKKVYGIDELRYEKDKQAIRARMKLILLLGLGVIVSFGFYIYLQSVRRRVRASEVATRLSAEQANADNEAKERLQSSISRSIRTPLNAVVGFASVIADNADLGDDSMEEYKEVIDENVRVLMGYVNGILDYSRLESGRMQFSLERCDWVAFLREQIGALNVELKDEGMPLVELQAMIDSVYLLTDKTIESRIWRRMLVPFRKSDACPIVVRLTKSLRGDMLMIDVEGSPLSHTYFDDQYAEIINEMHEHLWQTFKGSCRVTYGESERGMIHIERPIE